MKPVTKAATILLSLSWSASAIDVSVDIDSWTYLSGGVKQETCFYLKPNTSSQCIEVFNENSVFGESQGKVNGFVKTYIPYSNPNYQCAFDPSGKMLCSGGEPFLNQWGYVIESHFENKRYRDQCDFMDINLYFSEPEIKCNEKHCDIEVDFTSSFDKDVEVEAEIEMFNAKGRRIGRSDESENIYSPPASLRIKLKKNVSKVVLTDVTCSAW